MKSKDFLKWLKKQGATLQQGKGSHTKVYYGNKQSVVPVHNKDLKIGTLRGILKQLELTEEFDKGGQ